MDKSTGIRGTLLNFPFHDLKETIFDEDGIEIEISQGQIEIGVNDISKIDTATEFFQMWLSAWNHRIGTRASVVFGLRWSLRPDGSKLEELTINDSLQANERVAIQSRTIQGDITGRSFIVTQEMFDSASFSNDEDIFRKALRNPGLKAALLHFGEEVVDSDRPLYGIYKSIESITKHLGNDGRKQLGALAGHDETYVQDLMQTTQMVRHSPGHAPGNPQAKLDEKECRHRAKILLKAFADSLP